jgi:uncharacterized protein with FMN-binding domain
MISWQWLSKYDFRQVLARRNSAAGLPDGAYLGESAIGNFIYRVKVETNTDAITGATTTSKAYMKTVEDALSKADVRLEVPPLP